MVDFPTPPLAEETAITFFTSLMRRRSGSPRCIRGIVPARGNPFFTQSIVCQEAVPQLAPHTKGFSCCKALNVENNRGFMIMNFWPLSFLRRKLRYMSLAMSEGRGR